MIYYHNYHIVWTPKYRFRVLEGVIQELLDADIRALSEWKGAEVLELNIQKDHITYGCVCTPENIDIRVNGHDKR